MVDSSELCVLTVKNEPIVDNVVLDDRDEGATGDGVGPVDGLSAPGSEKEVDACDK